MVRTQSTVIRLDHDKYGRLMRLDYVQVAVWEDQQGSSPAGAAILDAITPLAEPCRQLASTALPLASALSQIDDAYHALCGLWECQHSGKHAYPQYRMEHLLRLIGRSVITCCQRALSSPAGGTFWEQSPVATRNSLAEALDALHLWTRHVNQLMRDWTPGPECISAHAWQGPPQDDAVLKKFMERLDSIRALLELQCELAAVVGTNQRSAVDAAFAPLQDVDCLQVRSENTVCTCSWPRLCSHIAVCVKT